MSLATRCNSCGTVFRVVQDQLRISEGWVRCGRCAAVFNAALELFDLDHGAPVPMPPADPQVAAYPPAMPGPDPGPPPQERSWHSAPAHGVSPGLAPLASHAPASFEPGADDGHLDHRVRTTFDPPHLGARHDPIGPAHEGLPPNASLLDPLVDDAAPAAIVALADLEPVAADTAIRVDADETIVPPSFVRAAERAAFWRQRSVRAGLIGSAALLGLLLAAQAGVAWRDPLAAHVPTLRPALEALCGVAGCEVGPLRRIDRLAVDSSGLSRLEGTPFYRLSLLLRSRADTALLAPALDLSLTDNQGRLVLRRVLQGAELGLRQPVIDAGQELPLQLLLSVGEQRVTGYSVELFYP